MSNDETQRKDMTEKNNPSEKKPSRASNFGYGAGGFIAGAATSSAFSMTGGSDEEIIETDIIEEPSESEGEAVIDTVEETASSNVSNNLPHYDQAPVAHVSDSQSFAQAFADARQQVGPGGCFEWHGKVYGTLYENEWNSMTPEQLDDYWASINAADIHGNNSGVHQDVEDDYNHNNDDPYHDDAPHDDANLMASDTELLDNDPEPVMKVEEIYYGDDGATAAQVSMGGGYGILIDADADGVIDTVAADFDGDGYLSDYEFARVQDAGFDDTIEVADLEELYYGNGAEVESTTQVASVEPDFNDYQPTGFDDMIAMEGGNGFDDIA